VCASERNRVSLSSSSRRWPMNDSARRSARPRRDMVPGPPCDRRPIAQDGLAAQLGAVVADDGRGLAALAEQAIELAGDPHAGDRGVEGTRGCSRRPPPGCADPADDRENPLRGVLVKASHVQPRCGPNRLGARDRHCATSRSYRSRRSILSATRNLGSRSPARSARSARQGGRSCQRH
jgi:hypothetical protein